MSGHETYLLDRARVADSHTLAVYRASGGYQTIERVLRQPLTPGEVIDEMKASGLRGRGGAGFPTGLKWSFMPDAKTDPRPRYMAVNADESEPGTCKDRVLMEEDPHGLIEGSLIAAWAMGLEGVYIYIRGEYLQCHRRMQAAVDEARAAGLIADRLGCRHAALLCPRLRGHGPALGHLGRWRLRRQASHGRAPATALPRPNASAATMASRRRTLYRASGSRPA